MPGPLVPAAIAIATEFGPSLVRWLTGSDKAEEVAEKIATVAQEVTGTGSPDAALTKLRADPQLVAQFQIRCKEIEADLDKAYLADRQDARKMAVEVVKAGGFDRKNAMIVGDVIGLVVCICVLVYVPELPGEVRGIISTIAGFFGLGLRDAHQFEFGSSRGSQEKNDLLAKAR